MRVLLIEDDETLGDGLRTGLGQDGHAVDWLTDGRLALDALDHDDFDVAILDLALPSRDGLDVLRHWRAAGHALPVLVLTAYEAVDDRVTGLDEGADDYVVKPVALTELDARLRALVRRRNGHSDNTLRWGDIVFDRARGVITHRDRPLVLSRHEQALLTALLERPGQTVTREQLGSRLYGWDEAPESNSIEVHVHNLRRKIGREAIQTVRGLGYRMAGASE